MNEIKFAQVTGLTSPNPLTLVCTKKEDGTTNLSTISWWMPLSFNPNLFAVAINKGSHGGDRLRETGEAVLVIPLSAPKTIFSDAALRTGKILTRLKHSISR